MTPHESKSAVRATPGLMLRLSLMLTASAVVFHFSVASVRADTPARVAPNASAGNENTETQPVGLEAPALQKLWREAIVLEKQNRFLEASRLYETLAGEASNIAYPCWKTSRNLWRYAESFPPEAKTQRLTFFERADEWASRGIARDPECAECMLWKFGSMGRIATTKGIITSVRLAPQMQKLLQDGIALHPTFSDSRYNTTLGNLYYAAAVFYRVVPDSFWLEWLIGVSGDVDLSLEMIRKAVAISPQRVDYNVELGATLMCYSARKDESTTRHEARDVLTHARELPVILDQDPIDMEHARILLAAPERACGYSRDGWIELSEMDRNELRASLPGG